MRVRVQPNIVFDRIDQTPQIQHAFLALAQKFGGTS